MTFKTKLSKISFPFSIILFYIQNPTPTFFMFETLPLLYSKLFISIFSSGTRILAPEVQIGKMLFPNFITTRKYLHLRGV